ncbi:MAG: hypothetical protein ACE5I8_00225 [Thermodesulfobacteriota bacterium]
MIRKTIWVVFMATIFVNTVALAQIGTVTPRILLVRSGPSKNHKVIAKMKRGERPLVERIVGNWVKLAWKREAWVAGSELSLEQGASRSSAIDEQFFRWLIQDTKVNWAFINRKSGHPVSLWVRMDSDRYGGLAKVNFIAHNLAESYRFHTGDRNPLEMKILKPDAMFIQDIYFQATFK